MRNLSYYHITKYEVNYNTFERQTTSIEPSRTEEHLLLHPLKAVWLSRSVPAAKGCGERMFHG